MMVVRYILCGMNIDVSLPCDLQGGPSGRGLHFADKELVVPRSSMWTQYEG